MHARTSATIDQLLDEAERRGACLVTTEKSLHKALDRRVRSGTLVSPLPKLYARAGRWLHGLRPTQRALHILRSLHELHPNWRFCGPSAAVLLGLSVSEHLLGTIHLAVEPGSGVRSEAPFRRHAIPGDDCAEAGGIPVTPLLRTTFDCARWLSFREGLAVADSALRTGGIPREALENYIAGMTGGYRDIAQARMTAAHADARSENGGESIARAAMWELGFALPDLQVEVPNPFSGSGIYRVDFRWRLPDGTEIYGEHDGNEKYLNPQMNGGNPLSAIKGERRRESSLTVTHASVMRFSPADVADTGYFDWLLRFYGVPKDHEPLIEIPAPGGIVVPQPPVIERVPVEAYGLA